MIAYLDLPSGISGDMFLAALIDAGWPVADLQRIIQLMNLPPDSWKVEHTTVQRGPLRASQLKVTVQEGVHHRHLADVINIIDSSVLPATIKQKSVAVFTRLAEAEAWVHNTTVDKIHFHEVGALDAIIDIVCVVAGLAEMNINQLFASAAPLGEGWTESAHGLLPLPAPATLHLLSAVKAPTRAAPGPGELITPTGAALLAELAHFRQPDMQLHAIGYGAGQKEFSWPNVARLWLGEPRPESGNWEIGSLRSRQLIQIETNIDDMNPELYGAVRERLFAEGALDVWTTPIQMKKERPGTLLSVLADPQLESNLTIAVLRETTTLGLRVCQIRRHEAERTVRTVETEYGPVQIKCKIIDGEVVGFKPEYEQCIRLANDANISIHRVVNAALSAAHSQTN